MRILDRLFGGKSSLTREFVEQRNVTRRTAVEQASERGVDVVEHAKRFAAEYDFARKSKTWDYFDAAMGILTRYPPQLAMAVISELGQHAARLGYNPMGEVLIAMEHLDRNFAPTEAAGFTNLDEIQSLVEDRSERMSRAAATIARVVYGGETLQGALTMYKAMTTPRSPAVLTPEMKAQIDSQLLYVNPKLGQYLINQGRA